MLWMSACGPAVGVGVGVAPDELLDPPSPEHPMSSNEKEQVDKNLRTTDELSDMETPRPRSSSAQKVKTKTEGCDTVWFFRGCPSCWMPHSFDSEEAANELVHNGDFCSAQFQVTRARIGETGIRCVEASFPQASRVTQWGHKTLRHNLRLPLSKQNCRHRVAHFSSLG